MNISQLIAKYDEDVQAVVSWCEQIYAAKFKQHFEIQQRLYSRLQSELSPITDEEIEEILTDVPIHLFAVAEELNNFRISETVIRLKNKEAKLRHDNVDPASQFNQLTQDEEEVDRIRDSLVPAIYASVITRVENEISFSRELIMSAKKIFDSRRKAESSMPVGLPQTPELPDYEVPQYPSSTCYEGGKSYIK